MNASGQQRAALAASGADRFTNVPVLAWVIRAGLRADFVDRAAHYGEFAAAAFCRSLKRGSERTEP